MSDFPSLPKNNRCICGRRIAKSDLSREQRAGVWQCVSCNQKYQGPHPTKTSPKPTDLHGKAQVKHRQSHQPDQRLSDSVWSNVLPPQPKRAWDWLIAQRRAALLRAVEAGDQHAIDLSPEWAAKIQQIMEAYQRAGSRPWEVWSIELLLRAVMLHDAGKLNPDSTAIKSADTKALRAQATVRKFKALHTSEREGALAGELADNAWRKILNDVWPNHPKDHGFVIRVLRGEGPYSTHSFKNRLGLLLGSPAQYLRKRRDPIWGQIIASAVDRLLSTKKVGKMQAWKLVHKTALLLFPTEVYPPSASFRRVRDIQKYAHKCSAKRSARR